MSDDDFDGVAEGCELDEPLDIPPLTIAQQKAILGALKIGAPRDLAARTAGRRDLDLLMARDKTLADDVDQAEAIGEVLLLERAGKTHALQVLARLKPSEYGASVARPLPDDGDDDDGRLELD